MLLLQDNGVIFMLLLLFLQDMESYLSQHSSENRATIEELKQELIVNSILTDLVKTESEKYVNRLDTLEKQVMISSVKHEYCFIILSHDGKEVFNL